MTAVARLRIGNSWPVMIGDILLSRPAYLSEPVETPTFKNVIDILPKGSKRIPSGLAQKICVIGDNMVVGWSGSLNIARKFVTQLYEENRIRPFTMNSISEFLADLKQQDRSGEVKIAGFLKVPEF